MEKTLSEAELKEAKEAFDRFDINKDGRITVDELRQVFSELGVNLTETEGKNMIAKVDENKNGTVEFEEFLLLMKNKGHWEVTVN